MDLMNREIRNNQQLKSVYELVEQYAIACHTSG